jgi:undecaprenyl-diphosphatase
MEDARRSFPSGHASFITLMVVSMWPALGYRMRWAGVVAIFGVCWARVSLGVHFPADVLAGVLFTMLSTIAVRAVVYVVYRKIFKLYC